MENEKDSAVDEFLGDLKNNDGDGVFETSKENPFGDQNIPTDEVVEEGGGVKEEKVPFHKDPKIQRFIQKEIEKATQGLTRKETDDFKKEVGLAKDEDDLIGAFTQIIGNDTPEKVHALKMLDRTIKGLEDKALSATRKLEAEREEEKQAQKELEEGLELIEESFSTDLTSDTPLARKTKGELLDFIKRIAPKDEDGEILEYPDFKETFKLFQEMKKPQPNTRARELASRSMARSSDASNAPQETDQSFKGVDKAFARIFKK